MFAPITRAYLHPPEPKRTLRGPRLTAVTMLLRASALLLHAAVRLQHASPPKVPEALLATADPAWLAREFHADAGAPEGALYVAGEFVGRLPGVQRL
jgi:hypothetical protein